MFSLYDFPAAYDAVMDRSPAVVDAEVQTVRHLLAQRDIHHGHILELACGMCAHGIPLAQRGFTVTGIDRSFAMLTVAQEAAAATSVPITLVEGDVVDFACARTDFDCAIFMFETFELITDYDDLVQHFATVRRHLKPGGLYIIDLHANKHGVGTTAGEWGRKTVTLDRGWVETWNEDVPGDWVAGTGHLRLHCRIMLDGVLHQTLDDWRYRIYSPWLLSLLVRTLEGWRLHGFYRWDDGSPDIADAEHYFMVLETLE